MTSSLDPYQVPPTSDTDDPGSPLFETTLTADHAMVDFGAGLPMAMAETFNSAVPGPTFRVNVGDSIVVRLKNNLPHATGIHWHGVEMPNKKDGAPFTQNQVPHGGTYLYKLRFPRAGLFWYHPHHHSSTNQVFRGLYGAIIVTDPAIEGPLVGGILPSVADTLPLVLSDVTVCKTVNDSQTYPTTLPWVGGPMLPVQPGPTPADLCQLAPLDEEGNPGSAFGAGEIPNIQKKGPVMPGQGRTNEGQTVLTNGMNVGHRDGSPHPPGVPGPLAPGPLPYPVNSGQGLRLQIFNAATIRYFRLLLTREDGTPVQLFRIGGEGGLLDHPILEGGTISGFETDYAQGEILLPAGSRADVVAAIPAGLLPGHVLTLWTLDYPRLGGGQFASLPTVPVAHFAVTGAVAPYSITTGTVLRSGLNTVPELTVSTGNLLDPMMFSPTKKGLPSENIQLTQSGGNTGVDGHVGVHDVLGAYTAADHMDASRYAEVGDIVELTVENATIAHHPFHLHGFSMQPKDLTHSDAVSNPPYNWDYNEFRDNIDIPPGYTLRFLVHLEPRAHVDDVTPGGSMGRWLFHCHIFFHAHLGMVSEVVCVGSDGSEKPYVDVNGSWAYSDGITPATRTGTYAHPDGPSMLPLVSLTATDALGNPAGTITDNLDGTWSWTWLGPVGIHYVYITGTDSEGRTDQAVFRVKIGPPDDGADNGDPHIHTVDGKRYDFQAAGEFTLLRDLEEGIEIQARQTPVKAANPITDSYSGLRTCVAVNTAVAARVGRHRISYQPWTHDRELVFFLDGKPADIPSQGRDLGAHRITTQPGSSGRPVVRVDYANGTVLIITPLFWNSYGVWYMNVSVTHTPADEGVMGRIPPGTWLPKLPNGGTVGPMPANLNDRYVALYRTFADAWRVANTTSLFVYPPGTSTETFTDREWPAEEPPCKLLPQFEVPGANPPARGMTVAQAARVCRRVTDEGLNQDCVFDVATTGDKQFAAGYELAQELRERATKVGISADRPRPKPGEAVTITAIIGNLYTNAKKSPRGKITFYLDGEDVGTKKFDEHCRASIILRDLETGEHLVRAEYNGGGKRGHYPSSSPNLILVVGRSGGQPHDDHHTHGHLVA